MINQDVDNEDRMSFALDQALSSKPSGKKLTGNEMLHEIVTRFDRDVDFRLNEQEFIDFLKALDPNWKEHIVDIAWQVFESWTFFVPFLNVIKLEFLLIDTSLLQRLFMFWNSG